MGASVFVDSVRRKDATNVADAFMREVERSRYESGNSYSGEIGMKHNFKRATTAKKCATLKEAVLEAERLIDEEETRYGDKWGPAFYIEVDGDEGGWVFFGLASS